MAYSPGFGAITKTTHDLKATQFEIHQNLSFNINDCEHLQNVFYIIRKPQKYDNSGVLWIWKIGPDGLEPPTKGLSLSVPLGMHECDAFNETDKSVILISKLSDLV